jgi:hypothetical protein
MNWEQKIESLEVQFRIADRERNQAQTKLDEAKTEMEWDCSAVLQDPYNDKTESTKEFFNSIGKMNSEFKRKAEERNQVLRQLDDLRLQKEKSNGNEDQVKLF